jgi:hypothetical protein
MILFAARGIAVPHMFRVRLREESTMRISEPADFDPTSLNSSSSFGIRREIERQDVCREMSRGDDRNYARHWLRV